jgi:hypothetical protein
VQPCVLVPVVYKRAVIMIRTLHAAGLDKLKSVDP